MVLTCRGSFIINDAVKPFSIANSYRLLQLDDGQELHDHDASLQRYLYEHYDACPETVDGNKGAFIVGKESACLPRLYYISELFVLFGIYGTSKITIQFEQRKSISRAHSGDRGIPTGFSRVELVFLTISAEQINR